MGCYCTLDQCNTYKKWHKKVWHYLCWWWICEGHLLLHRLLLVWLCLKRHRFTSAGPHGLTGSHLLTEHTWHWLPVTAEHSPLQHPIQSPLFLASDCSLGGGCENPHPRMTADAFFSKKTPSSMAGELLSQAGPAEMTCIIAHLDTQVCAFFQQWHVPPIALLRIFRLMMSSRSGSTSKFVVHLISKFWRNATGAFCRHWPTRDTWS